MLLDESCIKLSIIVPCYKVEQYLPTCLGSLVDQTLKDIEIVCVNDGSPDHCPDILHEWQTRHPQRIVVIDKPNEGVWHARRDGIARARGEYIGFLDGDDYAEPDFAELLYTTAKEQNADIVVGGFSRRDLGTGRVISREMCTPREPFSLAQEPGRTVELNGAPWNKIFRASVLRGMHDLSSPPPVAEDVLFHQLAYLRMQGTVAFVGKSLVNYMVREESSMNSITADDVDAVYAAFLETREIYETCNAPDDLVMALDATAFLHLGISLNHRLSSDPNVNLGVAITRSKRFLDDNFPTWRNSPYICGRYARLHGTSYKRLLTSSRMFKLGLMKPFLMAYRFVTDVAHVDIKW